MYFVALRAMKDTFLCGMFPVVIILLPILRAPPGDGYETFDNFRNRVIKSSGNFDVNVKNITLYSIN